MRLKIIFLSLLFSFLFSFSNTAKASCTPIQSFTAVDTSFCETEFYLNVSDPYNFDPNDYSYSWDLGDGQSSSDWFPSHNYNNPGSYVVTLYVGNGSCIDTITQTIVVSPCDTCDLNASFSYFDDTLDCLNVGFYSALTLTNNNYTWDFGDNTTYTGTGPNSSIQHEYDEAGTYQVTLHMTSGNCSDSTVQTVVVDTCPTDTCDLNASFTYGDTVECNTVFMPTDYDYTNNDQYEWDFGDGGTSTNVFPWHQYDAPGTYTVTLWVHNGSCADTSMQEVVVSPCDTCDLNASFSYFDDTLDCLNVGFYSALTLTNNNYTWDFGDNTTYTATGPNSSIQHEYDEAGTYQVTLYMTSGNCSDSTVQTVVVEPCPTDTCDLNASFTYGDTVECNTVFMPTDYDYTNNDQYEWDFGDGGTSTNVFPWHQYDAPGTYTVTLWVHNGSCADTSMQEVVVSPCDTCDLNASFSYFDDTLDCLNVGFYSALTLTNNNYTWDFGDNTIYTATGPNSSIQHEYDEAGTYQVTLYMTSGNCSDSTVQTVVVDPCPTDTCDLDASFTYGDTVECNTVFMPTDYDYTNNDQYEWDFGDGGTSTDAFPWHQYDAPGTYTVTLWVHNGSCADTSMQEVVVSPCETCDLNAEFSTTESGINTYDFSPVGYDSGNNYLWVFGDGTTSSDVNVTHEFSEEGDYYVTLVVSNCTCSTSSTEEVHVSDSSSCAFDAGFTYTIAPNGAVTFTPDYPSTNYGYDWQFGDGSSSTQTSPTYMYPANGSYTVSLSVWGTDNYACDDTTKQVITITNSNPCSQNIGFDYHWNANGDEIHFIPDVFNSNFDYFWDFGDGNSSTGKSPYHTYSNNGNYIVTLQVMRDTNCVTVDSLNLNVQTAGLTPLEDTTSVIKIYPNPAKDVVYLDFNLFQDGDYNVVMIDAIGQVVRQDKMHLYEGENKTEINLSSFSKGMYQIQVRDEDGELIKASKLVKQ